MSSELSGTLAAPPRTTERRRWLLRAGTLGLFAGGALAVSVGTAAMASASGPHAKPAAAKHVTSKTSPVAPAAGVGSTCSENSFFSGSPAAGSTVQPGQAVSVLYFDESEINPGGLVGKNGVTTTPPQFLVNGAVDTTTPVSVGALFSKGQTSGGFTGQDKFNHVLTATVPNQPGATVGIIAWDGDQNKSGGDCGVISWKVATPAPTHLAADILVCDHGTPTTTLAPLTGTVAASGPTPISAAHQITSTVVDPGAYSLHATAPTGYDLVPCGSTLGTATDKPVTLVAGDTKTVHFYAELHRTPAVSVVKDGPATGVLNGQGIYHLVATNTGNGASTASTITDTLPGGETFVPAGSSGACSASGQTVSCTLPALAESGSPGDSASFTVVVSYSATGPLTDCATVNGQANPSCVTTNVGSPNVKVTKSGPATGVLGSNGTYTLVAQNIGNAASSATTVFDTLPAGETFVAAGSTSGCTSNGQIVSCPLGALAAMGSAGDSASFTIVVHYTAIGDQTDCASAPGQATASCVTTHIPGSPSLSLAKTNDANKDGNFTETETASAPGNSVTFQIVVTNTSDVAITIDSISDAYGSTTSSECATLVGSTLAAHHTATCTFTIANYAPPAGSSLTDTVTVRGHDVDNQPVTVTDTSTVNTATPPPPGQPDLAITKVASLPKVLAGNTLVYSLLVSNVGQGPTTGAVTVTDSVPAGLAITSVDGGSLWDCSVSGQDVTCHWLGAAIQPGTAAQAITITTTVLTTSPATLINTGVVNTPNDNNPTNDRSTVKTPFTTVLGTKIVKKPTTPATLPFTGSRATSLMPVGLAAIFSGVLLMVAGRRRRRLT